MTAYWSLLIPAAVAIGTFGATFTFSLWYELRYVDRRCIWEEDATQWDRWRTRISRLRRRTDLRGWMYWLSSLALVATVAGIISHIIILAAAGFAEVWL